jgi:tetratricopeptide (TPR) repeat protein
MKLKSLRLLLIEKNPYDALTIINLILDDNENDVDALNQKGCILFLFDKCKEALECFNRCLIIDENYHYALFNKAIALRRIKELNKSLNCFDELLKTPQNYDKVKPYQLEILDKLHEEAIAEKS